jgi:hypothetical protein
VIASWALLSVLYIVYYDAQLPLVVIERWKERVSDVRLDISGIVAANSCFRENIVAVLGCSHCQNEPKLDYNHWYKQHGVWSYRCSSKW